VSSSSREKEVMCIKKSVKEGKKKKSLTIGSPTCIDMRQKQGAGAVQGGRTQS